MKDGRVLVVFLGGIINDYVESIKGLLQDPRDAKRQVRLAVEAIVDDILTENMEWTSVSNLSSPDRYEKLFIIRRLDGNEDRSLLDLLDAMVADVDNLIHCTMDLPTWHMMEVKVLKCDNLVIKVKEDYRIVDWMNRYNRKPRRRRRGRRE